MDNDTRITVIGLGGMGSAIAKALLGRGYRTTVWNRTASRAEPLAALGADIAPTAADAVAASPLVIICLLDGAAVDAVLPTLDAAVHGKVVVNVTSGSPAQARSTAEWARAHGAKYVDGGIMGDSPDVGTPNVRFTFSGDRDGFETYRDVWEGLGTIGYHGEDPGLAALEFMAQVAVGYEFLIGLLHTLALVRAEGADVAGFAERVAASVEGYVPVVDAFGAAIVSGEYGPDLGSLDVQAALMDDLISHRESLGVDALRMREVKRLMDERIAQGHGDQGFSSLFELLDRRAPDHTTRRSPLAFGPQLIGQTEKALNALLHTVLSDRDLTEREWVTLRLASQFDGTGDLDAFVAERLHDAEASRFTTALRERGLLAGSSLTPAGTTLIAEIGQEISTVTAPLWAEVDERDADAAARALNIVLDNAQALLRGTAPAPVRSGSAAARPT